jgi:hypothetical protein
MPVKESNQTTWTVGGVFELLRRLSPLRVISVSGPSVFEAIVDFDRYGFAQGHMNAMTPAYHWHLGLDDFGWIRSYDTVHERSGRRVLFLQFARSSDAEPFVSVYVHRPKGEEFDPTRLEAFARAHAELAEGRRLEADTREASS